MNIKEKIQKDADLNAISKSIIYADGRLLVLVNNYNRFHAEQIISRYGLRFKYIYRAPKNSGKFNGIEAL